MKGVSMSKKNRKWLVFTIMCLAYMPGSYAQYQLSVFAPELIQSFGLKIMGKFRLSL